MTFGRAAILGASVALGGLLLRAPAVRVGRGARLGEAREETAYLLGPGPLSFPVAPGVRELRVLVNLHAPGAPPNAGAPADPTSLRVRLEPEGREHAFAFFTRDEQAQPGTEEAVFYLNEPEHPQPTRVLGLERDDDRPGVLTLDVAPARGAIGAVRVQALAEGGLPTQQDRWLGVAAAAGSPRRRLYFLPSPPRPPVARARGVEVLARQPVTWTVAGPATLAIRTTDGSGLLRGVMTILDEASRTTSGAVELGPGRDHVFSVGAGLSTIELVADRAAFVELLGPASAAGACARAVPLADGRFELIARPSVVSASRLEPGARVAFGLRGRPPALPLRISARAYPETAAGTPARVRWRIVGAAGRVVSDGELVLRFRPAGGDRVAGSKVPITDEERFFVWPPADADRLELEADRPVEIVAASPAWSEEPDPSGDHDGDDAPDAPTRLRHGPPPAHRAYFPVAPLDEAALASTGRLDHLELYPRLEPLSRVAPPPSVSVLPPGQLPRVEMLLPDAPGARHPAQVWRVTPGRDLPVTAPGGAVSLIYAAGRPSGEPLTVTLDGRAVVRSAVTATRGQLVFGVPAGQHTLHVEAPPIARLFATVPARGMGAYRRIGVYAVEANRPFTVRVDKKPGSHVLGAIFYGAGGVAKDARLEIDIDGDKPRLATISRQRTRIRRAAPLEAGPFADGVLLSGDTAPTWQAVPVFAPLQDDLAAGPHTVALTVRGVHGPLFARFFEHGAAETVAPASAAFALGGSP